MIATIRNRFVVREGRFGRVLIAFMVMGFAALIVAGIAAGLATARGEQHTETVGHTYEVELAIGTARRLIEQSEASRRGYLLTGDVRYRDAYREWGAALAPALDRLESLTHDNPRQVTSFTLLQREVAALLDQRSRTIALVDAGRRADAVTAFEQETSIRRLTMIRTLFERMSGEERRLLELRNAAQRASVRLFYGILATAAVILAIVVLASLLTVLRYTRDLAASRDSLRSFNERLEETVTERTADLSRANEEIQRFAYIVSHDLRSPLVNVMGFTAELAEATAPLAELIDRAEAVAPEIVTQEARLAAREDLPEAIGFIRASTQKMDRLINAILKLSREGRRSITPERVDPATVGDAIVASIQHLIDDRGATVTIDRPLPMVITDRLALEQILSNLIENATKYLQPGRPGVIRLTGARERNRVILSVVDNGRGIAAGDHQRVFDLFRRAGPQDQPGEGIGLAHVRALAYRLGGTIDVVSTLGEGATFRLNLPSDLSKQDPVA